MLPSRHHGRHYLEGNIVKHQLAKILLAGVIGIAPIAAYCADATTAGTKVLTLEQSTAISDRIKASLAASKAGVDNVQVSTDARGVVTLSGRAKDKKAVDAASEIARHTDGVTSVTSTVQFRPDY